MRRPQTPFAMLIAAVLALFPAMADEYPGAPDCCPTCGLYLSRCNAIRNLFDAWYAKGSSQRYFESRMTYSECRVGGKAGAPERTDPNFLAWKELFRQYLIVDGFTCSSYCDFPKDFPAEWKEVYESCDGWRGRRGYVTAWVLDHAAPQYNDCGSFKAKISDPPPEMFGTDHVDKQGRSVDKYGSLDPTGGGDKDFVKYLIVPFVLAVVVALYFKSKGSENGPLFGAISIFIYAWLTNPWMVAGYFLGAGLLVGCFVLLGVRTIIGLFKK